MEPEDRKPRRHTVQAFEELDVYKLAIKLQQEVFEITKRFPGEERYALVDQFRRASRSVGANIAEAWHKRRYVPHFVSKLTDSDGEQAESQHWARTSLLCGYINREEAEHLVAICRRIGGKIGVMIRQADSWCSHN